jgi:hypothetical protein
MGGEIERCEKMKGPQPEGGGKLFAKSFRVISWIVPGVGLKTIHELTRTKTKQYEGDFFCKAAGPAPLPDLGIAER